MAKRFHRAQIIAETMSYFEQYYDTFLKTQDLSALVREYDELLVNRNKSVRVLDPKEPFDGKAMGITPKGRADRGHMGNRASWFQAEKYQ